MFKYEFTHDLRLFNSFEEFKVHLEEVVNFIESRKAMSTLKTKGEQNSYAAAKNTLCLIDDEGGLTECSKLIARGEVQKVLINFIKKFQYPNTKTKDNCNDAIMNNIKNAPLRNMVQLLFNAYLVDGEDGYIEGSELKNIIFLNSKIAKNEEDDFRQIYNAIKEGRTVKNPEKLIDNSGYEIEDRVFSALITLMKYSNLILMGPKNDSYRININNNIKLRSSLLDIITYNKYFNFSNELNKTEFKEKSKEFIQYMDVDKSDKLDMERKVINDKSLKYNKIVFGAPGTGKSFTLESQKKQFGENYERVTFHPSYSYAQFVGTYKPTQKLTCEGEITYKFVPGPFLRVLVKAYKSLMVDEKPEKFLLLIEEINRANVATVFGDVFQLLDRDDGISVYSISPSEDMKLFLAKELQCEVYDINEMKIPSNMYIWATMNSADQGVFPMDTAFKRRWDFEYTDIDNNEGDIENVKVRLGEDGHLVNWNDLRKEINELLLDKCKVNEDKLLGPFFLSKSTLKCEDGSDIVKNNTDFINSFKSKVIMYLFEDAAGRQHRSKLFVDFERYNTYSKLCKRFDEIGEGIFGLNLNLNNDKNIK